MFVCCCILPKTKKNELRQPLWRQFVSSCLVATSTSNSLPRLFFCVELSFSLSLFRHAENQLQRKLDAVRCLNKPLSDPERQLRMKLEGVHRALGPPQQKLKDLNSALLQVCTCFSSRPLFCQVFEEPTCVYFGGGGVHHFFVFMPFAPVLPTSSGRRRLERKASNIFVSSPITHASCGNRATVVELALLDRYVTTTAVHRGLQQ